MDARSRSVLDRVRDLGEQVLLRRFWIHLGPHLLASDPIRRSCARIHRTACERQRRTPEAGYTRFLRNRPQLRVLAQVVSARPRGSDLRMAILACSRGPEAYSALWTVRSSRPDLQVTCVGVDLSPAAIAIAKAGTYARDSSELEGLSEAELEALFVRDSGRVRVRPALAAAISWRVGDLLEPASLASMSPQDIVFANNFLIHMSDADAESCLRAITTRVADQGHLFVWGVNPDVKSHVLTAVGFEPDTSLLEEIHEADRTARRIWPFKYWGLEPIDKRREDWPMRYATVFRRRCARAART
jgi:hypothetical protein